MDQLELRGGSTGDPEGTNMHFGAGNGYRCGVDEGFRFGAESEGEPQLGPSTGG